MILFTKWDRFSRNASDAYQMIAILGGLGIEPQAIEQPLNMEIPESKIMLAFYLATPEVENDRRALNVKQGMRRARKEGRYMGRAPYGYDNKTKENGAKYITPNLVDGPQMQWIFKTIAEGVFAPDQVRQMVNEKGLSISRSNFYREIRNPVYCGKIVVKAYKEEEEQWVDGMHEPLISEGLFQEVQDVLSGRKINLRLQAVKLQEGLPLKGIISCNTCDRKLTASASKGRKGGMYYYYHAQHIYGCGCRYKADIMNENMADELLKFVPKEGMEEIYKEVAMDVYKKFKGDTHSGRKGITAEIELLNARVAKARELVFDDKLDTDDFRIMKKECEEQIRRLELNLAEAKGKNSNVLSIDRMISQAISALYQLRKLYLSCDVLKRERYWVRYFAKIYDLTEQVIEPPD
ncbi:recombinase family protein [Mucilaginibacter antarcticus]|uniref:recombinase family protein n=1 Tax=Mucilaginibacter antarcticus TaxID=1855725 RepID=UPI0036323131